MKTPLWIVTSALSALLILLILFVLFSSGSLFEKPRLAPIKTRESVSSDKKEDALPQNLNLIYEEYDLFGTYRPAITPVTPVQQLPVLPPAPRPIPPAPFLQQPIQFLPPLPLKITGIIASTNEQQSQVSLLNSNSLNTESLRVGDKILDAYILRIFPRKIIMIRSNGQQETLFMYPEEAKNTITQMQDTTWSDVVQQQDDQFLVNPTALSSRIHSLAEFIDMLNLTTASEQGDPIGIKIGNLTQTSLGRALGFMPGDIITKILSTEPISTSARMALFSELTSLEVGAHIPVELRRKNKTLTHQYTLFNLTDPSALHEVSPMASIAPQDNTRRTAQKTLRPSTQRSELDAMRMFGGRPDKGLL